ncbi:MAG TPA: hypothetical protein PK280_13030 [Planctomycetota bacterium]|nr:hypothetical protein [Planctomycetota bacterium]
MKPRLGTLVILAGLALACLPSGCGRDVKPPSLDGATKAMGTAEAQLAQGQLQDAERSFLAAFSSADAALKNMVPGDKSFAAAEKIRAESAAKIAMIREEFRKQAVTSGQQVASAPRKTSVTNLPPPVAPYRAPAPAKTPDPAPTTPGPGTETPKPPDGGATTPPVPPPTTTPPPAGEPPKPDTPVATPPPPAEPEQPKAIRITKSVLKGNKALVIHWTLTNLGGDKPLTAGAPAAKALNKRGGSLASTFQTFLADGFQYNADDPGASAGTRYVVDGSSLKPGESRALINVVLLSEAQAAQVGGAQVELRMSEGADLTDKRMDVASE